MDHWHNDSIAYAGVVVISDMEGMQGGDLELFKGNKDVGKEMLRKGQMKKELVETVSYENPGKMILTHGSEVCYLLVSIVYNILCRYSTMSPPSPLTMCASL